MRKSGQFRASIEETILDGAGRVDVSLIRGERRIACEISVTTNQDHELGNVEKCLAAGYTEVVLVGNNERHIKSLAKFIEENLDENEQGKVRYVVPEGLMEYLDSVGEPPEPTEQMVRGYKVRTVQQVVNPNEADAAKTGDCGSDCAVAFKGEEGIAAILILVNQIQRRKKMSSRVAANSG